MEEGLRGTPQYERYAEIARAYGVSFLTAGRIDFERSLEFAAGRLATIQLVLSTLGSERFGAMPARADELLAKATHGDLNRLERMVLRLLTARDWDDLLATP